MRASRVLRFVVPLVGFVGLDAANANAQGTDWTPFVMPGESPSTPPAPAPPRPPTRSGERSGPVAPDFGSEEPLEPSVPPNAPTAAPEEERPTVILEAPPAPFGSQGEFVVTAQSDLAINATSYGGSDASSFHVTVAPGLDYFLVDHFSVGLEFAFNYDEQKGYDSGGNLLRTRTATNAGGPRIGFQLPLGRYLSWYPRVTLGIESTYRRDVVVKARQDGAEPISPLGIPSTTKTGPFLSAFAPLLIHPTPHFFLGVGPWIFTEFANAQGGPEIGGQRTTVGGRLEVGAWWGGTSQAVAIEEVRPRPRFGLPKQLVFTASFGSSGWFTDWVGTPSRASGFSLSPGFDYFVIPHFAIGLTGGFSTSSTKSVTASSRVETLDYRWFALGPRVVADLPLSPWFSFYTRGTITIGQEDFDGKSDGTRNKTSRSLVTVSLYAPLLFHFASHAFVGFGPQVSHDIVAAYDFGPENPGTSVGASFTVGGWL
ncbi:hypothetical protein AKJ09_11394 [Labilithrix luteola]|uniref:Transporter n=1 Tax=Labilithrix luteola TaxID=1391654 RepID=A0A0K1QG49_9BACT|nr:porin family protein [Labilithrix luteola]AKV04731.1 hypothetical protein AKJ09_11394 [Labilithrix luteola]